MESELESQFEEIQQVEQRLGQLQNIIQGQNQNMQNLVLEGQKQTEEHLDSLIAKLLSAEISEGKNSEKKTNKLDLSSLGSLGALVPEALKKLETEENKVLDSEVDRQTDRVVE